ncbi:hypothetical protein BCR34DRAFT_582539 [Clohesyomyces aquaticus]|uniref:Uncharacterized protein n=1 Tax=Clohesyomyces aquaticus TaxID=1231657 RepID=A0A1Y2A8Z2_9PLEO|nr:hypothetical protein BCR34DRAFT_582539 [Clohesyomyces aquaticus]
MVSTKILIYILLGAVTTLCSPADFSGTGNIFVVNGSNPITGNPNSTVGCLTSSGRFILNIDRSKCGTFMRDNPQCSLASSFGCCGFLDPSAEMGRPMAPQFYAFKCGKSAANVNSGFYSLDLSPNSPYTWIYTGNLDVLYEAKKIPAVGEDASVFMSDQWRFPSPDRVELLLLWNKLS